MMRRQLGLDELARQNAIVDNMQISVAVAASIPTPAPAPVPTPTASSVPSIKDITLDPSKEYLWTKWAFMKYQNTIRSTLPKDHAMT